MVCRRKWGVSKEGTIRILARIGGIFCVGFIFVMVVSFENGAATDCIGQGLLRIAAQIGTVLFNGILCAGIIVGVCSLTSKELW
jgi:hypothetical protein